MRNGEFSRLLSWELRHTARSKVLWIVLLLFGASLAWSSLDTAAFHRAQTAAQERTIAAEQAHQRSIGQRREAYAIPATPSEPEVPYWQDPTSISGLSQYFLFKHAMKPHLPLSLIAAGTSDIAPSRLPIKLNTLFGFDDSYDFENPRGLAIGRFDMAFVLAVLLPVSLILIFGLIVTFERDMGMTRMIAAQSASARSWLAARFAAILAWVLPIIILQLLVAVMVAGVSLGDAPWELLAAISLVSAYVLLWTGICAIILSRFPTSSQALAQLGAVWVVLVAGLPLIWFFAVSAFDPAPSGVGYLNAMRSTNDAVLAQAGKIIQDAFAADDKLRQDIPLIGQMDHATRLTFLVPETERRLSQLRSQFEEHVERQASLSHTAGYLLPVLGLQESLAKLSGTDQARHREFLRQARAYQLDLRRIVYPLVQRESVAPSPFRAPRPRGRFNAPTGDFLPAFTMQDIAAQERSASVMPFSLWMVAAAMALITAALWTTRRWPSGA